MAPAGPLGRCSNGEHWRQAAVIFIDSFLPRFYDIDGHYLLCCQFQKHILDGVPGKDILGQGVDDLNRLDQDDADSTA